MSVLLTVDLVFKLQKRLANTFYRLAATLTFELDVEPLTGIVVSRDPVTTLVAFVIGITIFDDFYNFIFLFIIINLIRKGIFLIKL